MISQIIAVAIFIAMFLMIVWEKFERHITTSVAAALVIVLVFLVSMRNPAALWDTINLKTIITQGFWYSSGVSETASSGINWETIVFILGMMIMVEGMGRAGFFKWLCLKIAKAVKYKTVPILVTFMIMSAVLSMFIDSITVILFLAAVTAELSRILKFNPVPMIISEIFCANIGGSATMCGDPPNIIIGTSFGYSFADFLTNTGAVAGIVLVFAVVYFYLCFRKELRASEASRGTDIVYPEPNDMIESKRSFIISSVIFGIAVVLLVTHSITGLTVSSIGVFVALLTIVTSGKEGNRYIFKHIDYKTLIFFIGLFIVVGGLEQTKVLEAVAGFIGKISSGNPVVMVIIIIWMSAILSAFVDNIPFAATMLPVIASLSAAEGVSLATLAWTLSLGTDLGGNATPIGASANVMGISVAAKKGHKIGWGTYCKYAAPATIVAILICTLYLIVRYL